MEYRIKPELLQAIIIQLKKDPAFHVLDELKKCVEQQNKQEQQQNENDKKAKKGVIEAEEKSDKKTDESSGSQES